ncbi:unnamed protein product [Ixodes hexagonus]
MADRLSGVAIIICIALGVLTFLLLFIFTKRQIMRFTLKSKHSPHVPIGHGVSKSLKDEVDRRLLIIKDITFEPVLLKRNEKTLFDEGNSLTAAQPQHLFRMAVVDSLAELEEQLCCKDKTKIRKPGQDVRVFLLRQVHGGPFANCDLRSIHRFLDLYEHARHGPKEFGQEQYLEFMATLEELKKSIASHDKGTPVQKPSAQGCPDNQDTNDLQRVDLDSVPSGNSGRPAAVTEPLASCRPTSLAFVEDEKSRDAALETSV